MSSIKLTQKHIDEFHNWLKEEEKSKATIEKYIRDVKKFLHFSDSREINKELIVSFKQYLVEQQYAIRSINSMLASINSFLEFIGLQECKVKHLRYQREIFCPEDRELSREEYLRLLHVSRNNPQINLVMQTICSTGIRVSELKYFTVENVKRDTLEVSCKGKLRSIFLPQKLRNMLLKFAEKNGIFKGCIFVTRKGMPLDRSYIWAKMKSLCSKAGINPSKVFPHNLRKLFARTFYGIEKDIAQLADILGHGSIETTRIYIISTGMEHKRKIEKMNLLL